MSFFLLLLIGLIAVLGLLIGGVVKNRPAVAAIAGVLLLVGLMFGAGLLYFLAMPALHYQSQSVGWEGAGFPPAPPRPMNISARPSIFAILLFGAAVVAGIVAFVRWATAKRTVGEGGNWWPALLLVPLLLVLTMVGSFRVQRSARIPSGHDHEWPARAIHDQFARQQADFARQHAQLARQAAKMNDQLKHRIDSMDIHELMDLVDAPRIMLPMPPTGILLKLANATNGENNAGEPASAGGKAGTTDDATDDATAGETDERRTNEPDAQLLAEANAGVQSILGQEASSQEAVTNADEESDRVVMVAETKSARADKPPKNDKPTERETEAGGLSTPIAAASEPAVERNRPNWVNQPPIRFGEVQRDVLVTEEWSSEPECERARDIDLMLKTYEHIQMLVGSPFEHFQLEDRRDLQDGRVQDRLQELNRAGISLDYIHREIAKDEFLETVERSVGPMKKLYTLIEFTPGVDRELGQRWEAREREQRFWMLGAGASSVLGVLACVFGLLKIDTWTKGYYTKRLFLGVPAAIIGVILSLLALTNI